MGNRVQALSFKIICSGCPKGAKAKALVNATNRLVIGNVKYFLCFEYVINMLNMKNVLKLTDIQIPCTVYLTLYGRCSLENVKIM